MYVLLSTICATLTALIYTAGFAALHCRMEDVG